VTVCQLHMRKFRDGQTIVIEPFRARAFPVLRDLMIDRSAFDKIIQAGGYISVNTNSAPDANSIPVRKDKADEAMDAAACIGCGACVAACKNCLRHALRPRQRCRSSPCCPRAGLKPNEGLRPWWP